MTGLLRLLLAYLCGWLRLSSHLVRETVWLRRLSTPSDHLLVSTTDQVPARSHMSNLPARTHMDHIEAPSTRSDETLGKTSRLSQIPCAIAKACFFTLVVAGLSGCSSMVYAPIAGALQPSREMSASASGAKTNPRTMAYRTADPIAQKIQESLRGIY